MGINGVVSKEHRQEFKKRFPGIMPTVYPAYLKIAKQKSYVEANLSLNRISERLNKNGFNLSWQDDKVREWCESQAIFAKKIISGKPEQEAIKLLADHLEKFGLSFPEPVQPDFFEPSLNRLQCEKWWRKQARRMQARELDQIARDLRIVNRRQQIYVSNDVLYRRRQQNRRNRELLETMIATNEFGQEYTLAELSDTTVSKPENKRNELMVRLKGFEEYGDKYGHVAMFYTLTCPSRFHVYSGFKENEKYKDSTVRQAQHYLSNLWAKLRAKFKRDKIDCYGFRVAEPHHDGCPHWHFLLWFKDESEANRATVFFRRWALLDSPNERGASKHRFTVERIDRKRGSAVSYIAKYIAKNIDGHSLDHDLYGHEAKHSAERIAAWAACHGIRQFQQIGGASVTVWRELRRVQHEEAGEFGEFVKAADSADWCAYLELMGGALAARKDRPIKPAYWLEFDPETGEEIDSPYTQYGDLSKGRLFGLNFKGVHYLTREYKWTIERINKSTIHKSANDLAVTANEIRIHKEASEAIKEKELKRFPTIPAFEFFDGLRFSEIAPPERCALDLCQ